jgi:predicted metalloprotease with PDZ domain
LSAALLSFSATAGAPPARAVALAMTIAVDASSAPRGIVHVREHIPAAPGTIVLEYPRWLPGEHAPNGPIPNLASLTIAADGRRLGWKRDDVDLYAFSVDVPPGATAIDVEFDYLGSELGKYSAARLSTPNLLALTWNKVALTPRVDDYRTLIVAPSVTLPPGWQYATALELSATNGNTVEFAPVTFETLIDSPVDAGVNVKKLALGQFDRAPVELDAFADAPEELAIGASTVQKYANLVAEMRALYGARHFEHYNFLLTLSDVMPGEGLEHHQSSDDGEDGDYLTDGAALVADASLLAHEFNHSWNGKYRRPADLATANLHDPQRDDLLWVYEGMTEHYGELQAERAGLETKAQWLDRLALWYARLDTTTGRATTTLGDTAVNSPNLYSAPDAFSSARRGVDYYDESALMWLEADTIIRARSGGRRSLDDVARAFFGGTDTGALVLTYTRSDIVAALSAAAPYDWDGFFRQRVDALAPHPPDFMTPGGYALAFTGKPSPLEKIVNRNGKLVDLRYTLGIDAKADGTVTDVIQKSAAASAGIRPGDKISGVDGRSLDPDAPQAQLDAALERAKNGSGLRLLMTGGRTYHEWAFDVRTGPRYPHLVRLPHTLDVLSLIAAPKRPHPVAPPTDPPSDDE